MPLPFQQGQQSPQQQPAVAPPQQKPMDMEQPMGMEGQGEEFDPSVIDGEQLQMLLFSRIAELEPNEARMFADMITPETAIVLFKIFPELGILFDQVIAQRQQGTGQEMAGMEQNDPNQQSFQYEESNNPLVNDDVSQGLMG